MRRLLVVGGLVAVLALAVVAAVVVGGDDRAFVPVTPGTLTVATSEVPAAGFWAGRDADHVTGGFEADLAAALADQLGLDRVAVVTRSFEELVDGSAEGFDVALAQISITGDRERRLDLSRPYLTTPVAVVGRAGADEVPDLAAARELRWGVARSTTEADLVEDQLRPDADPVVYDEVGDALHG
ncbi:MAG TPA: transporter substrate-binding domain-containing protein, partial [Acidimicrobiales bacterium]